MAQTVVSICNSALIKVGCDRISSITQSARRAEILNAIFEGIRDEVLSEHNWKFAMKRAELTPTATTPDFEYDYEYTIPSDCLRPKIAYPDEDDIDFVQEGEVLLSNEATLDFKYIYRNESPDQWSALFAECLAWRLAQNLAQALRQSSTLIDLCRKEYEKQLDKARAADSSFGRSPSLVINTWTGSRR